MMNEHQFERGRIYFKHDVPLHRLTNLSLTEQRNEENRCRRFAAEQIGLKAQVKEEKINRKVQDVLVPDTWWDAFKHKYFPMGYKLKLNIKFIEWFHLERWLIKPPEMRKIEYFKDNSSTVVYTRFCPHLPTDDRGRHVLWLTGGKFDPGTYELNVTRKELTQIVLALHHLDFDRERSADLIKKVEVILDTQWEGNND